MKKNSFYLLLIMLLQLACSEKKTAKQLSEDLSLSDMNNILLSKTDSSGIVLTEKQKEASKGAEVDTLIKAMKVIYGADSRIDFFAEKDANKIKSALGVVALVRNEDLSPLSGGLQQLSTIPFALSKNLCAGEGFSNQPIGAFCSGFAIDKNIIVTAGHCIESEDDLKTIKFLFDFKMPDSGHVNTTFSSQQILTGKRILGRGLQNGVDFAVVETNEIIPQDRILKPNFGPMIQKNQHVYVIGHPVGLPLKIADRAFVRVNSDPLFFVANLDTYGGNSGSPVFNANTHLVEGILVRGETDFVKNGSCFISNVCPDSGCQGEGISRISQIRNSLLATSAIPMSNMVAQKK